ncbi:MAG TPA: S53 family peptidase [Gemmataceae bacterium]
MLFLEPLEDRLCLSALDLPAAWLSGAEAVLQEWTAHPLALVAATSPLAPSGYTPGQIVQAYRFDQIHLAGGVPGNGAGQTIAIVDAYDDPTITHDLAIFDVMFGLPAPPLFAVVNQDGRTALPAQDATGEWELEESLDVEWAHAVAPAANIVLVEANSDTAFDLFTATRTAASLPGVSAVSMSWGGWEFPLLALWGGVFTTPPYHQGVTFVAASGDEGMPIFPSTSPNVLSVGGTSLYLDGQNNWSSELAWFNSGGGVSTIESKPAYQQSVQQTGNRSTPDVAYNADPKTGLAVFDSTPTLGFFGGPWFEVNGTSAGAPEWAGLLAIANEGRALAGQGTLDGPSQTLPLLYQLPQNAFHDIASGTNGTFAAGPGYDLMTGRGSPFADRVVAGLVSSNVPPLTPQQQLTYLMAIPTEQFRALAYRFLAGIDPRDFTTGQQAAQNQLAGNPMHRTLSGVTAAQIGAQVFIELLGEATH